MTDFWRRCLLVLALTNTVSLTILVLPGQSIPKCSYGERGSLTAICINATSSFFRQTPYRFDHLDETLKCINCQLEIIDTATFDLSGNHIITLDLRKSNIKNIRSKAFIGLLFLEHLILSKNEIREIVPGVFVGIKKILTLDLQDNSMSALFANGFLELVNLEILNLRQNKISGITPGAFNGLKNLKELDLGQNQIQFIKGCFRSLPKLEVIYLDNNMINALIGDEFENLPALREIIFTQNKITSIPSGAFRAMPNLEVLDLSYNSINTITDGSFFNLEKLESLDLSNNALKIIPKRSLHRLFSVREIDLSFNSLNTFQTTIFAGLPDLRSLNLSHNEISTIHISGIFSLESMHSLDLSSNEIGDFNYKKLISKLPRISLFNLANNQWPCFLEKEMDQYFAEDNFRFLLYDESSKAPKCLDIPREQSETAESDTIVYASSGYSAIVWASVLLTIVIVAIGMLFYMQYEVYRVLR